MLAIVTIIIILTLQDVILHYTDIGKTGHSNYDLAFCDIYAYPGFAESPFPCLDAVLPGFCSVEIPCSETNSHPVCQM